MTPIEAGIMVALIVSSIQVLFRDAASRPSYALLAIALVSIAYHLRSSYFRWQLVPAYVCFVALVVLSLWGVQPDGALRYLAAAGSVLLLALSGALAIGFPVLELPAPDGRFSVGTIDLRCARGSDGAHAKTAESTAVRRLFIKAWYPAGSDLDPAAFPFETIWSEFSESGDFGVPVRALSRYLRNMATHSHRGAPIAAGGEAFPVLLYNHSLISIAGDNTFLMESLASHGFIVLSVRHEDQNAERAALIQATSAEQRSRNREYYTRLSKPDVPRAERSARSLAHFRDRGATTAIVVRRAADAAFVLDELEEILSSIPGCGDGAGADSNRIGVLGLSLGGAVATELCKIDSRCRAAVNLDGGHWGDHTLTPIEVPYLMLYSEPNAGSNDFSKEVSGSDFHEHVIPGTRHLDYHDAAVVLPALRWFRVLGSIPGEDMNRRKNRLVVDFFDGQLRRMGRGRHRPHEPSPLA